ncbi:histidinol-phosphate transaminase [soil metagenome]
MTRPKAYLDPPRRPPFAVPQPPPGKRLISLALNESPFGASPKAVAAIRRAVETPNRYPDPASNALRQAIGEAHGIDPERIVCGNGSEELLDVIGRLFVRPGDAIAMSQSGFFQFALVAARLGADLQRIPEHVYVLDVDTAAKAIDARTKILFLAIPNNPTGTLLPPAGVERLHQILPADIVLVLDLAYAEYLPPTDLARLMAYGMAQENIVITRTFSKAYGLAALRVGWLAAPNWMIPGLNLLRGVGSVNAIAQAAAAVALADTAFVASAVAATAVERDFLAANLHRLGISFVPGLGNFLLADFGTGAEGFIAHAMAKAGIWLRPVGEPGFGGHIRVGLGTRSENEMLIATLEDFRLAVPHAAK